MADQKVLINDLKVRLEILIPEDIFRAGRVEFAHFRLDHIRAVLDEVERLTRLNVSLLDGEMPVCGDCDGTGWQYNRVEGRYACTCMTEAEPYQILEDLIEKIRRVATGEDQVADDDTEGMGYISQLIAEAVRPPDLVQVLGEQKWKAECKSCGCVVKWEAKDFFDAADKHPTGWTYDRVLEGSVCPQCKSV